MIASEDVGNAMTPGSHGSTFAGNPLAMAVAEAVLDELSKLGFLEDVRRRAALLCDALERIAARHPDRIHEVRGRGFLRGVRIADGFDAGAIVAAMRDARLLTAPAGENTVRFLPPLIISEDEIRHAADTFETILAAAQPAMDT